MDLFRDLFNKILKNNDRTTADHKMQDNTVNVAQAKEENPSSEMFEEKRNRLAQLCKMGDTAAMYDMALLMLNNCSDEQKKLIYRCESGTCGETEFLDYMNHHRGFDELEYYTMWIIRASVYGNEKAKAILDRCPYYKNRTFIRCEYYQNIEAVDFRWSSNTFYEAGYCDIVRDEEDCRLIFHRDSGCFEFRYVSFYEPPDEDGFGAETEYDSIFYDEFFKKLPVRCNASRDEVLVGLKKAEAERDTFWKSQRNCDERKYKRLLKNMKQ